MVICGGGEIQINSIKARASTITNNERPEFQVVGIVVSIPEALSTDTLVRTKLEARAIKVNVRDVVQVSGYRVTIDSISRPMVVKRADVQDGGPPPTYSAAYTIYARLTHGLLPLTPKLVSGDVLLEVEALYFRADGKVFKSVSTVPIYVSN
jgi:hypothetical protein